MHGTNLRNEMALLHKATMILFQIERHLQYISDIFLQLFVGTRDGHLLMYGVTPKPGGGDHNVQLLRFFVLLRSDPGLLSLFQVQQVLQQEGHHAVGCGARVFHIGGTQGGNGQSQN